MANEHVRPAAAKSIFDDAGKAGIVNHSLPVQWIDQVAQALAVDNAGDVVFVGQDHRLGTGNPQLRGQRSLEELIVGGPHEGIIDHHCTLQDGIFKIEAVIWHFV